MTSPRTPKVITTVSHLQQWRKAHSLRVGFVPTMGALHEGHATLLRQCRTECETSVLSIFVNPTQFAPSEDLAQYPRTFEKDLALAAACGVDVVFAPTNSEIYPSGYTTYVEETLLSQPLCGRFRPGHFRGVTTVVLKLFNLVRPDTAFFGLKDAQQFFVLSKMVEDLNLGIEMRGIPTVRESDGLAMSSRNAYLSAEARNKAPILYQELLALKMRLNDSGGQKPFEEVQALLLQASATLQDSGFVVQYLECLSLPDLTVPDSGLLPGVSYLVAVAAFLGNTRLIDNLTLKKT